MARIDFDLDDLTNTALKRLVKQLLMSEDGKEKDILAKLEKRAAQPEKNDLADLVEETRGKGNAPKVEEDDLPHEPDDDEGLPPVPKKGKK